MKWCPNPDCVVANAPAPETVRGQASRRSRASFKGGQVLGYDFLSADLHLTRKVAPIVGQPTCRSSRLKSRVALSAATPPGGGYSWNDRGCPISCHSERASPRVSRRIPSGLESRCSSQVRTELRETMPTSLYELVGTARLATLAQGDRVCVFGSVPGPLRADRTSGDNE